KSDDLDAVIPSSDLLPVGTYRQVLQFACGIAWSQFGAGVVDLTVEMAPLPKAAILWRRLIEDAAQGIEIIEFQRPGRQPHVGPVTLPAFILTRGGLLIAG